MAFTFPPALEAALVGCRFDPDALSLAVQRVPHGADILALLKQEG